MLSRVPGMQKGRLFNQGEEATAALEFAIIAPVFIFMLFGMIAFGIYIGAAHSLQQVAAGAARASIAGLDEAERQELAKAYIINHLSDDAFLHSGSIELEVLDSEEVEGQFNVIVSYDASELPIWNLVDDMPLPNRIIRKTSTIRTGGI